MLCPGASPQLLAQGSTLGFSFKILLDFQLVVKRSCFPGKLSLPFPLQGTGYSTTRSKNLPHEILSESPHWTPVTTGPVLKARSPSRLQGSSWTLSSASTSGMKLSSLCPFPPGPYIFKEGGKTNKQTGKDLEMSAAFSTLYVGMLPGKGSDIVMWEASGLSSMGVGRGKVEC